MASINSISPTLLKQTLLRKGISSSCSKSSSIARQACRAISASSSSNGSKINQQKQHQSSISNNNNNNNKKSYSSTNKVNNNEFSSYLYPLRTEAPIITRTSAKEAAITDDENNKKSSNNINNVNNNNKQRIYLDGIDHFDDNGTLSNNEIQIIKEKKQSIRENAIKLNGSTSITTKIPNHIPSNFPSKELQIPKTQITTLDNGIRVVSKETYGQVTTIGIVADLGSRHESITEESGMCHILELLAFNSETQQYNNPIIINQLLQDWGGTRFVNYGREQSIYCIDILRPNVHKAMEMLSNVYLYPKFMPHDILEALRTIEFQSLDIPPELLLEQSLQNAAYGNSSNTTEQQQLGKHHFCPPEQLPYYLSILEQCASASASAGNNQTIEKFHEFWNHHIINNPNGLVIAGAGIGHEELVQLAKQHFGSLQQHSTISSSNDTTTTTSSTTSNNRTIPSLYTGGEAIIKNPINKPSIDGMTRISLAFELEDGWHSNNLVPTCVLQTLLGGGNSFSAGGPGKGMYSRLYRHVLNKYSWVESAEAFTSIHTESGLWGITGSCLPNRVMDLYSIFADHIARLKLLADTNISDEELYRARNMLKCNVLTQLESRLILFEDLGRQVLTYGHREEMDITCQKIDQVTKQDIQNLISIALNKPPTIAIVGDDNEYIHQVPKQSEIKRWFENI